MEPAPIWTPVDVQATAVDAFRRYVNRRYGQNIKTYNELHAWSVDEIPSFSEAVFDFTGIKTSKRPLRPVDKVHRMYPPPRWFPGARLNYAENMLLPGLIAKPYGIAVSVCDESSSPTVDYTYTQLVELTAVWANALRRMGVRTGDRVASKSSEFLAFSWILDVRSG
jgi:acetoacetyl-CoA synthetase